MVAAGLIAAGGGAAHATPADPGPGTASTAGNQSGNLPLAEPDYTAILKPGPPIELSNSEYGFIATHEVTKQLDRVNVVGGIAGLPCHLNTGRPTTDWPCSSAVPSMVR